MCGDKGVRAACMERMHVCGAELVMVHTHVPEGQQ
jgi:hypothetical protein